MRKLIEFTLVSADGVFEGPQILGFSEFRDDTYMRDGLAQALSCDAMLMGRTTYEQFKTIWPKRSDTWAERINAMPKYVFSSKLEDVEWNNCKLVQGDVVAEVRKLKEQSGRDLLIYGHGQLAETLMKHGLIDLLDFAIHPVLAGQGKSFFRGGQHLKMKVAATKVHSKGIVKITYDLQM